MKSKRKKMISAHAALKASDPDRLAEIRHLKREIKRLLKKGEWLYVENGVPKSGAKGH